MADEARLTIVIEEPTGAASAGAAAARPADDLPGWYPRYRELRNRADMGQTLAPAERAELDNLGRQLTEFASGAPAPPPAPAATATAAGQPTGVQPASATFRPPSPAPPGWNVPGSRQPSPPIGIYQPPSPAPPGWGSPPSGPPGGGAPPPSPADPGGFGPGIPGWENAYRSATGRPPADFVATADAAQREYIAGQRQRHTDRQNRAFREEIEAGEAGRGENAAAFDAATGSMSGGRKAMFGAAVGAAQASAAGESVMGGAATGAMAAAGGPVGLAAAAVGLAEEIKKKITQAPIDGINALADAAKMAAGNDGMGLFKKGAEAATGALEKIPVAGEAIALPFKVATAAATAFADVAGVFVARGRALSSYSGELAGSAARADVADLTADIREAQVLGPDTARLMDTMTDLNQMVREGLLPIKQIVVEVLAGTLTDVKEAARGVLAILAQPSNFIPKGLREWAERVLKALEGGADPDTLIQDWLGAADDLGPMPAIPGGGAPAPAGFGRPGAGGIGLPTFGRG